MIHKKTKPYFFIIISIVRLKDNDKNVQTHWHGHPSMQMHFTITVTINVFYFLIALHWDRLRPAVSCLRVPDQPTDLVEEEEVEEGWMEPSPLNLFFASCWL